MSTLTGWDVPAGRWVALRWTSVWEDQVALRLILDTNAARVVTRDACVGARRAIVQCGAGGGWDLRDLGAAHLHGSAHLTVRTREGDVGGGVEADDVIVVGRYGAEEGAVLEQAVGTRVEEQSASSIARGVSIEAAIAQCDGHEVLRKIAYYWGVPCRRHFRTGAALPTCAARSTTA